VSRFGSSAPARVVYERLGLTAEAVVKKTLALLKTVNT